MDDWSTGAPNPYAPPVSDFNAGARAPAEDLPLADRGTRLGAWLIDRALLYGPLALMAVVGALGFRASHYEEVLGPLGVGALVWVVAVCSFQWYRLSTTGQTLGKQWTGIKVVSLDGSPANFGKAVAMRSWLVGFLSAIPYLGFLFWLTDVLMIFRENRQCLHDEMAGTRVVLARGAE